VGGVLGAEGVWGVGLGGEGGEAAEDGVGVEEFGAVLDCVGWAFAELALEEVDGELCDAEGLV